MGQTLSEPITSKQTSSAENDYLKVGSSCMQGWRINMEDSHTLILRLKDDPDSAFFGVFDGHGGSKIACSISKNLHKYVLRHPEYASGNYHSAITDGFLQCDAEMRQDPSLIDESSGSTAITALLRNNNKLYVSNVGDSRCVGFRGEETVALSIDHKPNDPKEHKRIEMAGGFVDFNRVNGNLALSRAFGDFEFKKNEGLPPEKQIVTCYPDIVEKEIDESWNFMVLACDGIWDVLDNEEVVNFVAARIALNHEPDIICEKLMNRCLSEDSGMNGFGCDNMTVIIVCFLHNRPYSRLVERCAEYITNVKERSMQENDNLLEDELNERGYGPPTTDGVERESEEESNQSTSETSSSETDDNLSSSTNSQSKSPSAAAELPSSNKKNIRRTSNDDQQNNLPSSTTSTSEGEGGEKKEITCGVNDKFKKMELKEELKDTPGGEPPE